MAWKKEGDEKRGYTPQYTTFLGAVQHYTLLGCFSNEKMNFFF